MSILESRTYQNMDSIIDRRRKTASHLISSEYEMKTIYLDTSIISLTCSSSSSSSSFSDSSSVMPVALKIVADAFSVSPSVTVIGDISSSSATVSLFTSLRRLPKDGSLLPVPPEQYAGWQPSRHVRTFASNTRKFDSGILKALKRASRLSPSRRRSNPGNT